MAKKIDYPAIKKALWEAWRVFFPAFFGVLAVQFQAGVDIADFKNWLWPLIVSAVVAGVKAVFKWARETYFKGEYESLIYKLPA